MAKTPEEIINDLENDTKKLSSRYPKHEGCMFYPLPLEPEAPKKQNNDIDFYILMGLKLNERHQA